MADSLADVLPSTPLTIVLNQAGIPDMAVQAAKLCRDIPANKADALLLMVKKSTLYQKYFPTLVLGITSLI